MTRTSKQWIVRALSGALGATALCQPILADGFLHPRHAPAIVPGTPCPPGAPCPPITPQTTMPQATPKDAPKGEPPAPKAEPPSQVPSFEPVVSAALGDTSFAAGGGSAVFANMFGDQFRPGSGRSIVVVRSPGVLNGAPVSALFTNARKEPTAPVFIYREANAGASSTLTIAGQTLAIPISPTFSFGQVYDPANPYKVPPSQLTVPVALINSFLQPGAPGFQLANVVEGGKLVALAIVNPRGEIVNVVETRPGTANILVTTGDIQYDGVLQSTILQQFHIDIPNPSGGGVVGRTKISEDGNPLPRDRFIFNYDYFNNAALTPNGIDVNRFAFGFEKTFFNGNTSIEVRIPVAGTLDSSGGIGAQSRDTVVGNLRITPRALLYRSDTFAVGTGLGIWLPTAEDSRVANFDGSDLVRIDNETVILSPYLATLWTPDDRFFAQAWVAFDVDTAGNPVSVNLDGSGLRNIGRIREATLMQWDLQLGYWIFNTQDNNKLLQALAPFAELHYGSNVSHATLVSSGGFLIGDLTNRADQLNVSVGLNSIVGQQTNISVGAVLPLNNDENRLFDYQLGVRVNYFFGPTAANRRQAYIR